MGKNKLSQHRPLEKDMPLLRDERISLEELELEERVKLIQARVDSKESTLADKLLMLFFKLFAVGTIILVLSALGLLF